MKKFFIVSLFLLGLSQNVFAIDNCTRISGAWQGFFAFKDTTDCGELCEVKVSANVLPLDSNYYSIDFSLETGGRMMVTIECVDGKISVPTPDHNTIQLSCSSDNDCLINFDSDTMTAMLEKVSS